MASTNRVAECDEVAKSLLELYTLNNVHLRQNNYFIEAYKACALASEANALFAYGILKKYEDDKSKEDSEPPKAIPAAYSFSGKLIEKISQTYPNVPRAHEANVQAELREKNATIEPPAPSQEKVTQVETVPYVQAPLDIDLIQIEKQPANAAEQVTPMAVNTTQGGPAGAEQTIAQNEIVIGGERLLPQVAIAGTAPDTTIKTGGALAGDIASRRIVINDGFVIN